MIDQTTAIKDNFGDTFGGSLLGDCQSNFLSRFLVAAVNAKAGILRGSRSQGITGNIINELGVDMLIATIYR